MENWKPITGFEGLYEVSDLGRVKSLERDVLKWDGKRKVDSRILGLSKKGGYQSIGLWSNGILKTKMVHRLVAMAFIPNPLNKKQVNHKNGIKNDNRVVNLEWCTPKENSHHAWKIGLQKQGKGESHPSATIDEKTALEIKEMCKNGSYTKREIALMFGTTYSVVREIYRNKTWRHL